MEEFFATTCDTLRQQGLFGSLKSLRELFELLNSPTCFYLREVLQNRRSKLNFKIFNGCFSAIFNIFDEI